MVHVKALVVGAVVMLAVMAFGALAAKFPFLFLGLGFLGAAYFFGRLALMMWDDRTQYRGKSS